MSAARRSMSRVYQSVLYPTGTMLPGDRACTLCDKWNTQLWGRYSGGALRGSMAEEGHEGIWMGAAGSRDREGHVRRKSRVGCAEPARVAVAIRPVSPPYEDRRRPRTACAVYRPCSKPESAQTALMAPETRHTRAEADIESPAPPSPTRSSARVL